MANIRMKDIVYPGLDNIYTFADEAEDYSPTDTYKVGEYRIYDGKLYKCKQDISTAEVWTAAHWEETRLSNDVFSLESATKKLSGVVGIKNLFDYNIISTTGSVTQVSVDNGILSYRANGSPASTIAFYNTAMGIEPTCFKAGVKYRIVFNSTLNDATLQLYYKITSNVQIFSSNSGTYEAYIPDGTVGVIFRLQIPASARGTYTAEIIVEEIDSPVLDRLNSIESSLDKNKKLSNIGSVVYPTASSTLADILNFEKLQCMLHDNFSREDSATDIGSAGTIAGYSMDYSDIASSTQESGNIAVGISGYKAVATNPNNVPSAKRFKVKEIGSFPYKISITFISKGLIIISPLDTENYISIECTANSVSIGGYGSVICENASVTHNGNVSNVEAYVYDKHIDIYVASEKLLSVHAESQNTKCGIGFTSGDVGNISYTNVDMFSESKNIFVGIDNAVENCGSVSSEFIGNIQTPDVTYGVAFDDTITNNSFKSLRFELRKSDTSSVKRSEIVIPTMRPYNYNLQTKIVDFDFYVPVGYTSDTGREVILQQHNTPDGKNADGLEPNISIRTEANKLTLTIRSAERIIQSSSEAEEVTYEFATITEGEWHHIMLFLREGYNQSQRPCTAVWYDGDLAVLSRLGNAYNTKMGSYLKMGVYKPAWSPSSASTGTTVRTIYFDNINIWQ